MERLHEEKAFSKCVALLTKPKHSTFEIGYLFFGNLFSLDHENQRILGDKLEKPITDYLPLWPHFPIAGKLHPRGEAEGRQGKK